MFQAKDISPQKGERFLWVRFGALGDALQAAADAFLVKKKFPGVSMSFLTTPIYHDILIAQPYIDEVIFGNKKSISELFSTARLLREKKYDWIGSTYRGGHMSLLSLLGGVSKRIGDSRYFQFINSYNVYDWGIKHGFSFNDRSEPCIFAAPGSMENASVILHDLRGKKIFAVIGASLEAKILPVENWIKILAPLVNDGWSAVLNGHGEKENEMAMQIVDGIGAESRNRVLNLVGKLNFAQMSGVALSCDIAVGNDSGPLHMAALGGIPTIGISDYILPKEVGYSMPWFTPITAYDKPLGKRKTRHRSRRALANIPTEDIINKIKIVALTN
ncbi:MAG: glycosyltransferase family 9 protein [Synergistaceae bacterium]|nr:glycosyltransferase family 9 protein [Synergistaceae bacterium]